MEPLFLRCSGPPDLQLPTVPGARSELIRGAMKLEGLRAPYWGRKGEGGSERDQWDSIKELFHYIHQELASLRRQKARVSLNTHDHYSYASLPLCSS